MNILKSILPWTPKPKKPPLRRPKPWTPFFEELEDRVVLAAPIAVDDSFMTNMDTVLVEPAPGLLGNDSDPDGDPLTAVQATGPTNGILVFDADGSFSYTPNAGFFGTDTFTYKANDGVSNSNVAAVTITVAPPPVEFGFALAIGETLYNVGNAITTDDAGNVYTTGYFQGTADFDPGPSTAIRTSNGSNDIFLSKYDSSGNYLWARAMGGPNYDVGNDIFIDSAGNVYTTGYFQDTVDFDPGPGIANLISNGSYDIFVSKLDASGNFLWAKSMGGVATDIGTGISVDSAGNVYTTGRFAGTADFDPGPGLFELSSFGGFLSDVFVSKLDASGNFLWAKSMGGTSHDYVDGISIDSDNNVLTMGRFRGTVDFDPGPGVFELTSTDFEDFFISKLDASGNLIWARALGGAGDAFGTPDHGAGISVDSSGNILTTGYFFGTVDLDPGPGVFNLTSSGWQDVFISKLDPSGNFVWARAVGGTSSDVGREISVDSVGNVYTTGFFNDTADFDPGPGISNLFSNGNRDIFVAKIDASGNFLWARAMGGTSGDKGHGISVDSSGNVYTTGWFSGTVDFDPGPGTFELSALGYRDIFISKLTQTPDAFEDAYFTDEDVPISLTAAAGVLSNDIHPIGGPLTAILVTGPTNGSVTFESDGSFTYTPNTDYFGTDSFTYKANNGTVDSNVATVTITVNPVNDEVVKGNNGLGNGADPPPPVNDGPGTSPGNPGRRSGLGPKGSDSFQPSDSKSAVGDGHDHLRGEKTNGYGVFLVSAESDQNNDSDRSAEDGLLTESSFAVQLPDRAKLKELGKRLEITVGMASPITEASLKSISSKIQHRWADLVDQVFESEAAQWASRNLADGWDNLSQWMKDLDASKSEIGIGNPLSSLGSTGLTMMALSDDLDSLTDRVNDALWNGAIDAAVISIAAGSAGSFWLARKGKSASSPWWEENLDPTAGSA